MWECTRRVQCYQGICHHNPQPSTFLPISPANNNAVCSFANQLCAMHSRCERRQRLQCNHVTVEFKIGKLFTAKTFENADKQTRKLANNAQENNSLCRARGERHKFHRRCDQIDNHSTVLTMLCVCVQHICCAPFMCRAYVDHPTAVVLFLVVFGVGFSLAHSLCIAACFTLHTL